MNLSFLISQMVKKSSTISSEALAFGAQFLTEFSGQWAATDGITAWDTDVLVITTAQLNTEIATAIANPTKKTRIRISASFANTASTTVQFNGTATQGNFITNGGALLVCPDTTEVNINSTVQINGCRGIHIKGLMFARTLTDANLNKNWIPSDGGTDPQDTNSFIVQRNSTRPLWSILRFDNCKFGAGFINNDAKEWMTVCSFSGFEEIVLKNCSWKGGKAFIKTFNYRRFRNINPDFQLVLRDVLQGSMTDVPVTCGTISGSITIGSNVIESTSSLSIASYNGNIASGMLLNGAGIPGNTTILSFNGPPSAPTQITMSASATATSTLTINIQDCVRSRYQSDVYSYSWESGGTRRNYYDNANEMTTEATPRLKGYYDNHSDAFQLGVPTDLAGYKVIIENMCMYAERTTYYDDTVAVVRKSASPQAIYMDDSPQKIQGLFINNIIANDINWNIKSWNGSSIVESCSCVRVGSSPPSAKVSNGDQFNYTIDWNPSVSATRKTGTSIPTSLTINNTIAGDYPVVGSNSQYEGFSPTILNSATASPVIGVANYGSSFEGTFSLDSEGRNTYTFSDTGSESQAQFRAALYAQFKPKGSLIGKGARDPSTWTESNFN